MKWKGYIVGMLLVTSVRDQKKKPCSPCKGFTVPVNTTGWGRVGMDLR